MRSHLRGPITPLALSALAMSLALPTGSSAQEDWNFDTHLSYTYQFETDLDDVPGDFEFSKIRTGFNYGGPLGENVSFHIPMNYEHRSYNFDSGGLGLDTTGTSVRFSHVNIVSLWPTLSYELADDWSILGTGIWEWSAENGSSKNASTGGGVLAARKKFTDNFSLGFGLAIISQLEDSAWFLPVLSLDWKITDSLRFASEPQHQMGQVRYNLTWDVSDSFATFLSVGWDRERFRLDGRGAYDDGVAEYQAVPVGAGVAIKLGDLGTIRLNGGVAVNGKLRVENSSGKKVVPNRDFDDPAPYASLEVKLRF